eukprot:TRINITY_DN37805_c0_g2_i1.p2 TRINITY_DN37805_c0_g2~~TRINITY_DN37805_c0_g2_i1.p2  ORF type:complete len:206 (-),score=24.91 TRINITY_DN37805_c0_g2_i1:1668-2285(-)
MQTRRQTRQSTRQKKKAAQSKVIDSDTFSGSPSKSLSEEYSVKLQSSKQQEKQKIEDQEQTKEEKPAEKSKFDMNLTLPNGEEITEEGFANIASEVITRVQQQKNADDGFVKVYYAGMGFGVSVSRESVSSRAGLASVLDNAFTGKIMSCGSGKFLGIIGVNKKGSCAQLPPLDIDSPCDQQIWEKVISQAIRLYVYSAQQLQSM